MKNPLHQILAFCCGLALLFPLAACQTSKTPEDPSTSEKPPVESKTEDSSALSLPELTKQFKAELDGLAEEYDEQLEKDAVIDVINEKKAGAIPEEYRSDLDGYLDSVRTELNNLLPFRSYGSLIGPNAPADYSAACDYIRAEFEKNVTEENRADFEEILAWMEDDVLGAQSPSPYTNDPQLHFDAARQALWSHFQCTVDTNPYFFDHP